MLQIDQIVVGIGVEGRPATGGGPASCRIGRGDKLGLDWRCAAERGIIEYGQILRDRAI